MLKLAIKVHDFHWRHQISELNDYFRGCTLIVRFLPEIFRTSTVVVRDSDSFFGKKSKIFGEIGQLRYLSEKRATKVQPPCNRQLGIILVLIVGLWSAI